MKKLLKSACLFICCIMLFTACSTKTEKPKDNKPIGSLSTSSDKTQSTQPTPEPSPYDDLLGMIGDYGQDVKTYGDLEKQEYATAINELDTILDAHKYNISVVAYTMDNRKAFAYNTEQDFFCACTVKAAYSLYCCQQMEAGKGNLNTEMVYEKKHYEPGTGDMQYSAFGTKFKMSTIIDKSMRISDNVGYLMSVDYFGRDGYNKWIADMGCESLQIKPTVWSLKAKAKDLAYVWREMYEYFEKDNEYSKFLYNSCTNTPNNYATAALKDVTYSHKQGNNRTGKWLALCDAGIVWRENSPYIVVVLTDAPGPNSYSTEEFAKIINIIDTKLF